MTDKYDVLVRGGQIVDGTGTPPFQADVAIADGRIVAIGNDLGAAHEEIDAAGCVVTPGFVDIHTHLDAHVTWANRLLPSSIHGVTTAVMGNCGVGFAPCRPDERDHLIRLMEGIEDIPDVVLKEGLSWDWESFPDYLDLVSQRQFDMDVAAYLPHAPLRVFVMGERASAFEQATAEDIARMRQLAREAVEAGALGFATSRSVNHRAIDGELTPSLGAVEEELTEIAMGMSDAGSGVIQFISDWNDPEADFGTLRRVSERSGRPLTFALVQSMSFPERWRTVLDAAEGAANDGLSVTAQVCGRPIGVHIGLGVSYNPFSFCPSYKAIAALPLPQRLVEMRDPTLRSKIIAEYPGDGQRSVAKHLKSSEKMYVMTDPPNYAPCPSNNLAALAQREGVAPAEYIYDLLTSGDGTTLVFIPVANYADGNLDAVEEMLRSNIVVPGLGDSGAHCGTICDAGLPTYMLMQWAREPEGRLSLPGIVKALSADTAAAVGLGDRGRIQVGLRGDLNIIALDRLSLHLPEMIPILPTGGGLLSQRAEGYVATLVAGQVTYRDGESTGALPGRLVRGSRSSYTN